jgi:hypothetical protein
VPSHQVPLHAELFPPWSLLHCSCRSFSPRAQPPLLAVPGAPCSRRVPVFLSLSAHPPLSSWRMSLLGSLPSSMAASTTFSCRCFSSGARPCVGHGAWLPSPCFLRPGAQPHAASLLGPRSWLQLGSVLCRRPLLHLFPQRALVFARCCARSPLSARRGRGPLPMPSSLQFSGVARSPWSMLPALRSPSSVHVRPIPPTLGPCPRCLCARQPRLSCSLLRSPRSPPSSPYACNHVPLLAVLAIYVVVGLVSPTIVTLLFPAAP